MRQILLDNAYESWKSAVINHDRIMQGFSSLYYKKTFVSSLHNSIELFLKQLMLNANKRDVASLYKKSKSLFPDLEMAYNTATNLNVFFRSLSVSELNAFHSINFEKLIKNHEELLNTHGNSYNSELALLQRLRNNETHFYINANDYLSEGEFVKLHNFMINFFQNAMKNNLFPRAIVNFDDMKYTLSDEDVAMNINWEYLESFSYIDALKENKLFLEVVRILQGENEPVYANYWSNNYELAECIVCYNKEFADSIDDIFTILQLMSQHGMFEVCTNVEEIEAEDREIYQNREDSFLFHL